MKNKNTEPVIVSEPNVTKEKMEAIVAVAKAVLELAKAINSTNTAIEISNCHIENTKEGISIKND